MKKKKERMTDHDSENEAEHSDEQNGSETSTADDELKSMAEQDASDQSTAEDGELNSVESELEELRLKAEEYLDGWQRARAEFSNYKKRVQREREEDHARITGQILGRYLDVVDDFERALKDSPSKGETEAWSEGIDLIYRKMKTILETEGVEEIEAEGALFNPTYHEAIFQEETSDHKEDEIIEVIQRGYMIGDRILRPAQVRIAK